MNFFSCSGQRFNARADQAFNSHITSYTRPFALHVRTDQSAANPFSSGPQNQRGFQLQYQTLPCN